MSPVLFMGPATRLLAVKAESPALHMDLNAAHRNEREIGSREKERERVNGWNERRGDGEGIR